MNDPHTILIKRYFFEFIDRGTVAEETPLFTRRYEGEALAEIIARQFHLSSQETEALLDIARQEVTL